MSLFDLTGKTAVATGTTKGLGKAMALALAEYGADMVLLQRDTENTETKNEIISLGRKCSIVECDLLNMEHVRNAIGNAFNVSGKIDILLNCAGMQRRHHSEDFTESDWDDVINVNLKSVFILCRDAAKIMIRQHKGKIINIASLLSFQGGLTVPAYAASKGGIAQLTKAFSNEWASYGINVNAIAPGYMDTDMNNALINDNIRSRQILERIPQNRWGTPDDLKGSIVFLASDASNYVNGHILVVDGGWLGR